MRRTVANVAVGMLAGAALVGGPAMAAPDPDPEHHGHHMNEMMSSRELREEMRRCMSKMMSDSNLRDQMQSMMSAAMGGMPMMDSHH